MAPDGLAQQLLVEPYYGLVQQPRPDDVLPLSFPRWREEIPTIRTWPAEGCFQTLDIIETPTQGSNQATGEVTASMDGTETRPATASTRRYRRNYGVVVQARIRQTLGSSDAVTLDAEAPHQSTARLVVRGLR